ncbi:hypothetical protein EBH_0029240 [Eimeria brunetti]|uniref:Uncharacterized protein n=1 Tax=Eimeria brunetti TaxID=51314 RepID=U6L965_9EIME|nr:hypothetical protein EBH_0029240 [Eimeria brunetti]
MPDVDSTSEGHANESIGQAAQMPSYLSVAPLNEKQRPATRSPPRTDKRLSRADSDGYGLTPEKMRRVTYGSSVERDAVTKSSAVQHFGETVQQAADSVFVDFKLSGIPPLPTSVGHQQGQATSVASLQGAGQTQLLATPVLRQSPTIHPQTYALSTGITLPFPEAVVDPERPCASQSEWAPAGQTGLSVPTEPSPKRSNGAPTRVPEGRQSLVTEASSASRTKHPFVATPTLMPYVNIDDVVRTIEDAHLSAGPISGYLRTVRYMSLQPALSHLKAAQLVRAVLSLAKRALVSMTADIHMRASSAAESLGRRFLVIEAFHRFLKVTGDSNPRLRKVWNDLLANIPTTYDREPWGTWDKIRAFQHELSQNLSSALELYKNGSSPSEEEIINLKRKLFCMELSPRCFRSPIWDLWREDDREFSGAP